MVECIQEHTKRQRARPESPRHSSQARAPSVPATCPVRVYTVGSCGPQEATVLCGPPPGSTVRPAPTTLPPPGSSPVASARICTDAKSFAGQDLFLRGGGAARPAACARKLMTRTFVGAYNSTRRIFSYHAWPPGPRHTMSDGSATASVAVDIHRARTRATKHPHPSGPPAPTASRPQRADCAAARRLVHIRER